MKLGHKSLLMEPLVLLLLLLQCGHLLTPVGAQFLFTYEINQEDDSRAPKSSLFDPSSFKVVTPSQLQSSYQKLSSQPLPLDAAPTPAAHLNQQPSNTLTTSGDSSQARDTSEQQPQSASLFKQTSAALQSFAELFNLAPSSSPSPLGSQYQAAPTSDQQAEARSLEEQWTQQQLKQQVGSNSLGQMSHQSALSSFTTSASSGPDHKQQHFQPQLAARLHQAPQQSQQSQQQQQQQQPPAASFWLTANPLSGTDGNYLVAIKQPTEVPPIASNAHLSRPTSSGGQFHSPSHSSQASSQAANMVDNLLAMSQRPNKQQSASVTPSAHMLRPRHSAQSSFLATPTSYYPRPTVETSTPRLPLVENHLEISSPTPADTPSGPSVHHNYNLNPDPLLDSHQLQPPANIPENFVTGGVESQSHSQPGVTHKSAEESLMSYRRDQQQHQQERQSQGHSRLHLMDVPTAQQSGAGHQQHYPQPESHQHQHHHQHQNQHQSEIPHHLQARTENRAQAQQEQFKPTPKQQVYVQQESPRQHSSLGEIPKVSPQIYESFLLQQRDQHEKHMELLKQQQELNRLLEQKQKQQEAEQRRKKKEELERQEARKRALQREHQEAQARKVRLEKEEKEARKRKAEEEERKRQQLEEEDRKRRQLEEARRYREYLEAREQAEREAQLKRQAEEELREKLERERAEAAAAEKKRREKEAEESRFAEQLRHKEELRKLLELKRKDDEPQEERRQLAGQLATGQQHQHQQQQHLRTSQAARANKLAEELRQRGGNVAASWGTPIRARQVSGPSAHVPSSTSTSTTTTTTTTGTPSGTSSTSTTPSSMGPAERRQVQRVRQVKKQRADEKLIRQKIPLYSGAGKYGLYRAANDSLDLAALLDSVTLPVSTSTSSAPSPDSTGANSSSWTRVESTESSLQALSDRFESSTTRLSSQPEPVTPSGLETSSSLSPLLTARSTGPPSAGSGLAEPFFDDDVPRRPARGLSAAQLNLSASVSPGVAPVAARARSNQTSVANAGRGRAHIGLASLPADSDNDGIPGRAGIEYPVLHSVPPTSFSCSKQPLNGYYADTETACQVVHLCQAGVQSSILCPNGTIFNQEKFSCQWWYEVNCSRAPIFYQLNDNLYKSTLAREQATAGAGSSFLTDTSNDTRRRAKSGATSNEPKSASNSLL